MTKSAYSQPWWASAVFYQVYPRSFADGNGDGTGDLIGLRARLEHIERLGAEALWISPFYRSPMADGGYDVADPCDVDPLFGTLADFDALLADAHARGLKVTIDVVPNHFSDRHPWFQAALAAAAGSPERARFVFRDGRGPHGELPPNNWPSVFGGPAWTKAPGLSPNGKGQWYLHLFACEQPDLDWTNAEVLAEFERILRFWLDRGVDGFRIDVAHGMAKPPRLPDLEPDALFAITHRAEGDVVPLGDDIRWDRDAVHEHHRALRRVLDSYPGERMAVGEVWVHDSDRLARYVRPDELNLAFNFELVMCDWGAEPIGAAVRRSMAAMSGVGAPCTWVLDNHDVERVTSRYGNPARARAAALVQLSLPGAAYVYNGDELGLPNVELPDEALRDPAWERSGHTVRGRDGERVPLPWSGTRPPYGFSTVADTWLPMPDGWAPLTVAAQDADPDSTLWLYRRALRLRRKLAGLRSGGFAWVEAPAECIAYRRGDVTVLLNAGDAAVPLPAGEVQLASGPLDGDKLPANTAVWVRTVN